VVKRSVLGGLHREYGLGGRLRRSVKRPKLSTADRLLWAWLSQIWVDWRSSLLILKPETVICWHRKSFRMFRTWKVRRGQPGRPTVPKEVRKLIRKLSRENPLWGAPRIHGELVELGIDVGERSVGKYMPPHRNPPSQTSRTFLESQLHSTSRWTSLLCRQFVSACTCS
jgi:putative transposase